VIGRLRWRSILRGMLLTWLLVAGMEARALQVVDDRGVTVVFAQSPQRILTVLPSLTEMVCALGQCQRLVGTDRYSNYPESVRRLPKVGGGLDPNVEAIIALKPDAVLLATSSPLAARLQSLGIRVVALEPKTHADVQRVFDVLGQLLGVTDARRVWQEIDAGVDAAARSLPQRARNLSVYFEVNDAPYAAGEASFIGETLARLGVRNIVPAVLGPFPRINPEYVVRANPDLIMVGDSGYADLARRPGWNNLAALKAGRVCVFSPEQSDVMVRPGPRMADAARLMAHCLANKAP